ncbi:MAG: Lrp/AsnC family transcriptional regulator [Deltaproteobacteria bacterium]|jgi:DNA-binding Lrp family transcriptional regulator|nr:Lrp/AsnC family transcriptional regulator [Deltaproteobacteria bacterium]NTV55884.1 Lrp/AsnC family transcriptional regulator [Deltaproteobacteria bacterium]
MDAIDRKIINAIQSNFPISLQPYQELGKQLHLAPDEVLKRVKVLKAASIIRRIGGNFHSHRLNYTSTLCAARVPEDKIEHFVEVVNNYPGVTHNYLRKHDYNIWFTFIAPSTSTIENALKEISEKTGVKEVYSLPAVRMFKIRVDFEV